MNVLSPFISVLCHSDISSMVSPAHVLMLSIYAVHCLHRLRAPDLTLFLSPGSSLDSPWRVHKVC